MNVLGIVMLNRYRAIFLLVASGVHMPYLISAFQSEKPSVFTVLRQNLSLCHMQEAMKKHPMAASVTSARPTYFQRVLNIKGIHNGNNGKSLTKSSFTYDFYPISDARTDLYLGKAKCLLNRYYKLPDNDESTNLENRIDELQLKAANECAKWITPTLQSLREGFKKIKDLKRFRCPFVGQGKVPIEIGFKTRAWSYNPRIELASLCTWDGGYFNDKDILKSSLAHETNHLVYYDGLWRGLDIVSETNSLERSRKQEIDADIYACTISKSSCLGRVKKYAGYCKMASLSSKQASKPERTSVQSYSYVGSQEHASSFDLLQLAVTHAQDHWGVSPEECQRHILEGEKNMMDLHRNYWAKKALHKK